eukprot:CAMPEP_0185727548 /NCGR_PEP_ID=MMETSP1171-20130828/3202_1 /TAXON_ID=374046 /ORGANISM="Helicotheca tamensis, Strain CCMP826" /LENGTH=265 /DNA_ID=CAMNT_0028396135 /DNA_START=423 /DNA_END=1217 /DNA_ORIENTATION=-
MGNLLGAPITDKETHVGVTDDGLDYGVSSMQGWRIHMEDAHILQPHLYAEEKITPTTKDNDATENGDTTTTTTTKPKYTKIDLPNHSLYAVFDGHGGTFAAEYAGRNLCRVLSRQPKFVSYAKHISKQSEEESNTTAPADPQARAAANREGMELLEAALRDAFVDLDMEIIREVQNLGNVDANTPYGDVHGGAAAEHGGEDPADRHPEPSDDEDSGTTAVVVMITPQWIVCANAGDSRAVYSKDGNRAIPLSYDHKPDDEEEERR